MNSKGYAAWLSTKMSTLLFAATMFAVFFLFFQFEINFEHVDKLAKTTQNIARTIDSVYSSPYKLEVVLSLDNVDIDKLIVNRSGDFYYLRLEAGGSVAEKSMFSKTKITIINRPDKIKIFKKGDEVQVVVI